MSARPDSISKFLRNFFTGIFIKLIFVLEIFAVLFLLGLVMCIAGVTTPGLLLGTTLNGLFLGSIYGLIALGYTMVYGILKFINFAHGEVFMIGAVVAFVLAYNFGAGFIVACVASMAVCGVIGALIERFAYRPLRQSSRLTPLITAIGVSLLFQSIVQMTFGPNPRGYLEVDSWSSLISFLDEKHLLVKIGPVPVQVSNLDLIIISVAIFVMIALHLFITYTKLGKAIRATADDFETASTIGINVDRVITATFVVGSMLAALGGIFYGLKSVIEFNMGVLPGIKAFTAAVVGGIGNIYGAMLGGIIIGVSEKVGGLLISTDLETAIVFVVLIVFLIFRPRGILGKKDDGTAQGRLRRLKKWLRGTLVTGIRGSTRKTSDTNARMGNRARNGKRQNGMPVNGRGNGREERTDNPGGA